MRVRELFRRFWPYLRPDRAGLVWAGLLLVIAVLADAAGIWMFMVLTDQALATGKLTAFWWPAATWLGIAVLGAVASYFGAYRAARIAENFLFRLRGSVYQHVQELPPHFFARRESGDLVARFSGDVESVERLVASGPLHAVTALLSVVLYAGAALYLRWDLAVLSFALAPVFWLIARRFAARIRTASTEERAANGAMSTVVAEGIANVALIQAYNQQQRQSSRLADQAAWWYRAKLAEARMSSLYSPLVTVVETGCILLVLGMGIWEISQQRITIGGLIGFAAYIGYLYPPLQNLGEITMTVTSARAAGERLVELLDEHPAITDAPRTQLPMAHRRGVRFEQVGFGYPEAEKPALTGFDLSVRPGEFVLVTGPSGVGKSTLTKLLLRYYDPDAGRITVDGVNIVDLELRALREEIALVPQEVGLMHATVAENIAFGRQEASRAEVVDAARQADADAFIRALPQGYDTVLGESGALLSGGQRRRISIARAILRNASVLVLDEPTNGLDSASASRVLEPLRRLAPARTIILISHDLSLAAEADRVVVLDGGRIVDHDANTGFATRPHRGDSAAVEWPLADDAPTVRLPRPVITRLINPVSR